VQRGQSLLGAAGGSHRGQRQGDQREHANKNQSDDQSHLGSLLPTQLTSVSRSNRLGGKMMPDTRSLSRNRGRMRVGLKTPITRPSCPMPFLSNVKISCMLITFSSMPVISEMLVILRVPSLMRVACTTIVIAEAICCRTDLSGRFMFVMATMDSSRDSASRGVLA